MKDRIKIGLVGVGKIARDQHIPAIDGHPGFELIACADPNARIAGIAHYQSLEAMLDAEPDLAAVSLCAPPQVRFSQACVALAAGKHVLLEKPPGASVAEVAVLAEVARERACSLFTSWHSRHAPGVKSARAWLANKELVTVMVRWKEDVRLWHPGQDWIWQPGGLGVFDPGINALSIVTRILPRPFFLKAADLYTPSNKHNPIAANLDFRDDRSTPIRAEFDWRHGDEEIWEVEVTTTVGVLRLAQGGKHLQIDGKSWDLGEEREYSSLYERFAELISDGASEVDFSPLQHVADAMLLGTRYSTAPFFH
ncbi:L-arabinose 1-dehydrogenase (NADP+) [Paraburkholderia fungorum]|uniref:L-arabinose 1-dehydrogenase (NADP+) n=1 Tax=Paraburkholderia fungorum TaxID=134537 RepID=A0A1H1JNX9_9BURK|nr:Gfo/Idh/MocA family oxidoreductase [Paraburkholderia fungorum]SDR51711.1 L-arabinose 1-dehydrogenase (NADP+) [Paraburkholderia fungorum]